MAKKDASSLTGGHGGAPQPEIIRAEKVLGEKAVRPYHEIKDQKITTLAIFVVGLVALVSSAALFWQVFFPICNEQSVCTPRPLPDWPAEMLRLALVASLAFVMGGGGKQS